MPICKDCGNRFKDKSIKICEVCGSDNISLGADEFDINKYKKEMKTYTEKRKKLALIFLVIMITVMLVIMFLMMVL